MRHARQPTHRLRPIVAGAAATGLVITGVVAGVTQFRSAPDRVTPVAAAETVDAATSGSNADARVPAQAGPPALGKLAAEPQRRKRPPRTTRPAPTTSAPAPTRPEPPAPSGGKPGPGNTGAGTGLRVVTGDQTYAASGQVVTGLDVHGKVRITGKNVTLRNVIVRGPSGGGCRNGAVIEVSGSATIENVTVAASAPTACLDGINAHDTTIVRTDISNVVDGVKAADNVTVQDSYIHDLAYFASDPNQGGGPTHNDSVQTFEGNSGITLRHNTLLAGSKGNAALQVTQDGGGRATNIRVESNWLDGGGCTLNFSHKGGPAPMTGITVTANRFGRNSAFGCPILVSTQTQIAQSGNVYDDTGGAIPAPQRHD